MRAELGETFSKGLHDELGTQEILLFKRHLKQLNNASSTTPLKTFNDAASFDNKCHLKQLSKRSERACMSSEILLKVEALYELFNVVYCVQRAQPRLNLFPDFPVF